MALTPKARRKEVVDLWHAFVAMNTGQRLHEEHFKTPSADPAAVAALFSTAKIVVAANLLERVGDLKNMSTPFHFWEDNLALRFVRNSLVHKNGDLSNTKDAWAAGGAPRFVALQYVTDYLNARTWQTMTSRKAKQPPTPQPGLASPPFIVKGKFVEAGPGLDVFLQMLVHG